MNVWYTTDYHGPYAVEVSDATCLTRPCEQQDIAQECAADFHSNHDGFECFWPREFTLYATKDGEPLASLTVDRETQPVFYAYHPTQAPA